MQQLRQQHIIVDTYSQSTFSAQNNDNHFIVNFGTQYDNVKRLQLNSFSMLNFMSNISNNYSDFSYNVNGVAYTLTISHVYLTLATFFNYFNQAQSHTVLSYTQNNFDTLITIQSTQPWSPVGIGWTILGFGYYIAGVNHQTNQLGLANATSWSPIYPYDFSASPVIYIVFNNIANGSTQGDGNVSFMIPNESSYGTLLVYNNPNQYGNQMVVFQSPITITYLDISIYDVYKQLIHTTSLVGDDDTEVPICLSMTAYSD